MLTNNEIPWIIGTFPDDHGEQHLTEPGEPIWPGQPAFCKVGSWEQAELRTAEHPLGRLAVSGQCLSDQSELESALARAVEKDDPAAIGQLQGSYAAWLLQRDRLTLFGNLADQFTANYRDDGGTVQVSSLTKPLCGPNTKI